LPPPQHRGGRPNISLRQVERKRTAAAGSAAQLNLSAQQTGQLAADSQTKAGPAVFPAGARVRLLEGLEDDALLFEWNANASIGNLECNYGSGLAQNRVVLSPTALGQRYGQPDAAQFRELKSIG
jgi:hypothetical protein